MKQYEKVSSANFIDIDEAYKILDVTKDVDDDTLVVVYQVRVSPFSSQTILDANGMLAPRSRIHRFLKRVWMKRFPVWRMSATVLVLKNW